MNYGQIVKAYRKKNGLTQKEFGDIIGVSPDVISNWERNKSQPLEKHLVKLSKVIPVAKEDLTTKVRDTIVRDDDEILDKYYRLDEHGKRAVMGLIETELERMTEEKKSAKVYAMYEANTQELVEVDYYQEAAGMGLGQSVEAVRPSKLELPAEIIPEYTDFMITVVGDSMEPTYFSGDILFVQSTNVLNQGDIGVFSLGGEELVKEYGGDTLISHNKKYAPIECVDGCYIQGRVLGKYET